MLLGLSPTLVAALLTFGPDTVSAERAAEIEFLTLAGSYGPHSEVRLLDDLAATRHDRDYGRARPLFLRR